MVLILIAAAFLRFPGLDDRVMHGDEAVNAVKFANLWQGDGYRYDPHEFHGPTLPYFTLPVTWFHPAGDFAATDESFYRLVPVAFGMILVLLTAAAGPGVGWFAALLAALFVALSPAMSFYSRYYIHEMLLVVFTFGAILAGWRYVLNPGAGWAIVCGAFLGLMHATKETCVIAYFAMAAALVMCVLWNRLWDRQAIEPAALLRWVRPSHIFAGVAAAVVISVTFFTSFFTNWQGPFDSVWTTYFAWLNAGVGEEARHVHPWHWYLSLLGYHREGYAPWFSEGLILGLAVAGFFAAIIGRGPWGTGGTADAIGGFPIKKQKSKIENPPALPRFLAFYTLVMVVVYSSIPYKTPWTMLGFFHGMVLLAGVGGAAVFFGVARLLAVAGLRAGWATAVAAVIVSPLLAVGLWNLYSQARLANFRMHTDDRNPYVYAHPVRDARRIGERADQLAAVHPDGHDMLIRVIDPGNYWPIPFYLRGFSRVGYHPRVPDRPEAAMIAVTPALEAELIEELGGEEGLEERYHFEYFGLRPGLPPNLVLIPRDLWDAFIDSQRSGGN